MSEKQYSSYESGCSENSSRAEEEYLEESSIDNSDISDDLSSQKNYFAIRLNDGRDWFEQRVNVLNASEAALCKQYPLLGKIESEDRMPTLINAAFPDGMQQRLFIRNLSFNDSDRDHASLGIRPKMHLGSRLFDILGAGNSLLFIGHIRGREFIVDRVMDAADTECLPYEVD